VIVRLVLSVLLLGLAPQTYAQLYKWVDSEGHVHYTDTPPPPDARQDQKLNIKKNEPGSTATPAGEAPAGPQSTAEKELDFKKRKVEQEQTQAKSAQKDKEMQEQCENARRRLYTYQDAGRIYTIDEKGERVYPEDSERQRYIDEARGDIAKYCK
jgi:uncharacterized protein DUF4124